MPISYIRYQQLIARILSAIKLEFVIELNASFARFNGLNYISANETTIK